MQVNPTPPSGDGEEADLVRRAITGEESAWEILVRKYQEPVFRIAYLFLADADDAEDVAQETFLRAYRSLKSFDLSRPLRPWLVTISANQARNFRRSAGRYWKALQNLTREVEHSKALVVAEEEGRGTEYQDLWRAVRKLPQADQQIIYYRYFLDLPVSETAQALGIADGTVKSRLARALTRLEAVVTSDFPSLVEEFTG